MPIISERSVCLLLKTLLENTLTLFKKKNSSVTALTKKCSNFLIGNNLRAVFCFSKGNRRRLQIG